MKKILFLCLALSSSLAIAVGGCGVEQPAEEGRGQDEATEVTEAASEVQAAASGHWYLVSSRSCFADFNTVCSDTVPARQCAGDPNPGELCPSVGAGCNRVLGPLGYQVLKCI